ncbi:MAG: hypothetical protein ABI700_13570, partial [Chloroflexota bacterium]
MDVYLSPSCMIDYYTFYVQGLYDLFGGKSVRFSAAKFPLFKHGYMTLVFEDSASSHAFKVIIDAFDKPSYANNIGWCDVYAKVNVDPENIPEEHAAKILPIGPSFSTKVWTTAQALVYAGANFFRTRGRINQRRRFLAAYLRPGRYRLPESAYQPEASSRDSIFFAGTLWDNADLTNQRRAAFIETCRSIPSLHFEGGFAPPYSKRKQVR